MKKKLLVSVRWMVMLLFIFGGCEKSTIENHQDVLTLKAQEQRIYLSLIDEITLELPEAGPDLGLAGSIVVVQDYIIILDGLRKSVDVFDIKGSYKWSIGSHGNGKGQYKIPRAPTIIPNTNQMLIYDAGSGRILRFSLKGEFVGEIKLSERRFIKRMLVSEDHNLIHTYANKNKNGMLCVTSLDTGEDLAEFKVSDSQNNNLFSFFGRFQGLAYDEAQEMIYFVLPWEEKIMRIDLTAQRFLKSITLNQPKFINVKVDDSKNLKELRNIDNFSRLNAMHLFLPSGDILLRYLFNDTSKSTGLILLSNLSVQPSAEKIKNELGVNNIFTCYGMFVYRYSPPEDDEDTNGRISIYRLIDPDEAPIG